MPILATAMTPIAVVVVESLMACFGVLIAYVTPAAGAGITAIVPVLAGIIGAAVSLVAAVGLLCMPREAVHCPARQRQVARSKQPSLPATSFTRRTR